MLRFGALSIALGQLLMPFAGSVPVLVAVMALVPIGTAMLFPATTAQVSRHAPAGHVGEFMGLQQALGGVSRMLAPVWAGFVFQHLGVPWPFWIAATLMAAVGALAWGAVTGESAEAGEGAATDTPQLERERGSDRRGRAARRRRGRSGRGGGAWLGSQGERVARFAENVLAAGWSARPV